MDQLEPTASQPDAAKTFQQHQQHQQHQESQQLASPASPTRKLAALDLDRALYLQSRAASVQEPNRCRPAAAGARATISVDYIDCVSNQDLGWAPAAMGAIPTYRKHFRFHRNRVDASSCPVADAIAQVRPQQPQPQASEAACRSGSASDASGAEPAAPSQHQSQSVLYPISVGELKQRSLMGFGPQESLLGADSLQRHFPGGRVSVFVATWNQNRRRAPANLADLLLPDQLTNLPDIYAIGVQEAFSLQQEYLREWEVELQATLGANHVLLHSCSLGVLHLSLFVRRELVWFCSAPEESVYNSRSMPTNMIKTKGAVSIAFSFFGTSLMFTNCHFPAHEHRLRDRLEEYQRVIASIDLPKNLKLLKPRYLSNDSTARFDCCFFMGDLNFRLEQRTFDETLHILEDIFAQPKNVDDNNKHQHNPFESLTQHDELLKAMDASLAFHGFDEATIRFPPTYKFLAKTNKYDRQTKRVPSYTDRILFRSKRQRHIQCLLYDWLPQLLSSDHKPVYCLFSVLVRPGRDRHLLGSANAGHFGRAVYLDALRRQADPPEHLREPASLICSIS